MVSTARERDEAVSGELANLALAEDYDLLRRARVIESDVPASVCLICDGEDDCAFDSSA